MTDVELVTRAQAGDTDALATLVGRYRRRAYAYARGAGFYLPGSDVDDLAQEAVIGLLAAIRNFKPTIGDFWPFALLCIRRHLITLVVAATREKRAGQTITSVRDLGDEDVDVLELLPDPRADVPRVAEANTRLRRLFDDLDTLTPTERRALIGVAVGCTYVELGRTKKSIDNAVQRARRKLAA